MRGRNVILVAGLLISSLWIAPAAVANSARFRDGNDTRGPLDIQRISHSHRKTAEGPRLVHTVRLRDAWPVKKLGNRAFMLLYFDLRGNRGATPERTLQIEARKGRLVARMFGTHVDPAEFLGRVALRHPDRRTLRVALPKSLLRTGLASYRWNAVSAIRRGAGMCRRAGGCIDWAPDSGRRVKYVKHVL